MGKRFTVVGLSGSLRKASLNTLYLQSLAAACPDHIEFSIYHDLGTIPPFNVDRDESPPDSVLRLKAFLGRSDMIVIASPEYAHGISGVLKNALDWLVSDYQLLDRPLAFPNVSTRATIAQSHAEEVFRTMGFMLVETCSPRASLDAPLVNPELSIEETISHLELGSRLHDFWNAVSSYLSEHMSVPIPQSEKALQGERCR